MDSLNLFHRLDDVAGVNRNQIAVMETLHELGLHALLAAIPDSLTAAMSAEIARFPDCEVFQHGVGHINRGADLRDEFPATLDRRVQRRLLRDGKHRLEQLLGRPVVGYVPPWNYVSPTTLHVLGELGFHYLSAHVRHRFETPLVQINVSVNVFSQYHPVKVLGRDELKLRVEQACRHYCPVGILYHPAATPKRHLPPLCRFIRDVAQSSMTKSKWDEHCRRAAK